MQKAIIISKYFFGTWITWSVSAYKRYHVFRFDGSLRWKPWFVQTGCSEREQHFNKLGSYDLFLLLRSSAELSQWLSVKWKWRVSSCGSPMSFPFWFWMNYPSKVLRRLWSWNRTVCVFVFLLQPIIRNIKLKLLTHFLQLLSTDMLYARKWDVFIYTI